MLLTVFLPMSAGGLFDLHQREARRLWKRDSAPIWMPGAMRPPGIPLWRRRRPKVVAVPKSTTNSRRPYISFKRHGVHHAVGPHLVRMVVVDGDARLEPRADGEDGAESQPLQRLLDERLHGGDDAGHAGRALAPGFRQGAVQHQCPLIRRAVVGRGEAQDLFEGVSLKHAEDGVGVSDINGQQHGDIIPSLPPPDSRTAGRPDSGKAGTRESRTAGRQDGRTAESGEGNCQITADS